MTIEVTTGQTKAPTGTLLVPVVLGENGSDRVFLLIHVEGKAEGGEQLKEESIAVLTHAVLEAEGSGYERLESALKELNGLLKGFLLSETVRDVHAVVGLFEQEGVLHLSNVGRAEAYLVRDGSATQVTEYSRGKPAAAFMHIVSGPMQPRDQLIVSTQRLLRTITPAQLAKIANHSGEGVVETIVSTLQSEKEVASVLHVLVAGQPLRDAPRSAGRQLGRNASRPRHRSSNGMLAGVMAGARSLMDRIDWSDLRSRLSALPMPTFGAKAREQEAKSGGRVAGAIRTFMQDLRDPERKRRAHLLLLAGGTALFLVIWMFIQLSVVSQRSQTKGELAALVQQINADVTTADNRHLAGDDESANAILARAEERARSVMDSQSGLYRSEALELLDRIKSKREEMNKVTRVVPPRVMANLSAKKSDIIAQGFIGLQNGEFLVYDRQDLYRVSLNTVEGVDRLGAEELILDGTSFPRFQANVFLTTGNSVIELAGGQPTTMKTEDPAGWVTGSDIKTYLRYAYILSPERKQIYKYERLSSKYGPPAEYNVSGDLTGALDMTITGPVYVLKDVSTAEHPGQRDVVKLLRGEKQAFAIRNLPPGALDGVTKFVKSSGNGNFYFLDPEGKRVIVTTSDGDLGDSLYLKQYILDSDQVTRLKDLYVDSEDARLYVLDEKKLYAIDLQSR